MHSSAARWGYAHADAARPRRIAAWLDRRANIILLLPAVLVMTLVFLYPILYALFMSVHHVTFQTLDDPPWVGLGNFIAAVSDPLFQASLVRTVLFVGSALILELIIGMTLALGVSRMTRGRSILTAAMVLPMMITPVVVGLMWKFMLDYNFGIVNWFISALGFPRVAVLSNADLALPAIVATDLWQWTPFMFIVLLAGIKALPREPYEAAMVDGANAWQTFWNVTVPALAPVTAIALLLRGAGLVKEFDKIFVLTGGGPGSASLTLPVMVQKSAFLDFDFGYSSALGVILAVLVGIGCWFTVRFMHKER